MNPPPDGERPPNMERLDWRLTELEGKVDRGFAELRADMRGQMSRIEGSVERLQFVDVKLYQSEQTTQNVAIANLAALIEQTEERLNKRIDRGESRQSATLTLVIGAILAALAAGLVRLAIG